MLADLLFFLVVTYILYKFVFGFLVPVARATRHVRQQFRHMQGGPGAGPGSGAGSGSGSGSEAAGYGHGGSQRGPWPGSGRTASRQTAKPPADEYIDFEEIK